MQNASLNAHYEVHWVKLLIPLSKVIALRQGGCCQLIAWLYNFGTTGFYNFSDYVPHIHINSGICPIIADSSLSKLAEFTFFANSVVLLLFLYCEYNFAPIYIHLHLFCNKSALYMLQDITRPISTINKSCYNSI